MKVRDANDDAHGPSIIVYTLYQAIAVLLLTLASSAAFSPTRRLHTSSAINRQATPPSSPSSSATSFDLKTYLEEKRVAVEQVHRRHLLFNDGPSPRLSFPVDLDTILPPTTTSSNVSKKALAASIPTSCPETETITESMR